MNTRAPLLLTILGLLLAIFPCSAQDKPEPAKESKNGFRKVKLLSVSRSETRGQNLKAMFKVLGEKDAKDIIVRFPSHSHTDHERHILGIIYKSADWTTIRDRYAWRKANREVTFSVPKDAGGYKGAPEHYKQWRVLKVGKSKEENGKDNATNTPPKNRR